MNFSTKENTAGVVVLYNPNDEVLSNIQSYLPDIAVLYVIDNSEVKDALLVDTLLHYDEIEYIDCKGNAGLGYALNLGATLAVKANYRWLLTMDQDSKVSSKMLLHMRQVICEEPDINSIGIVAPYHQDKYSKPAPEQSITDDTFAVMTSGNLLNLHAYQQSGAFETKFFIDYIDIEYCFRLRENGFKILIANRAVLYHNLGNITKHTLLGKQIGTTNHSYIRRYYITRNSLYVVEKYRTQFPEFCKSIILHFWKELIRILLFEEQKILKLKYIFRGYKDFKRKIFNKL